MRLLRTCMYVLIVVGSHLLVPAAQSRQPGLIRRELRSGNHCGTMTILWEAPTNLKRTKGGTPGSILSVTVIASPGCASSEYGQADFLGNLSFTLELRTRDGMQLLSNEVPLKSDRKGTVWKESGSNYTYTLDFPAVPHSGKRRVLQVLEGNTRLASIPLVE